MKSKKNVILLIISIAAVLCVLLILLNFIPTPNIIVSQSATATQINDDKNVSCQLSDEDSKTCVEMFEGKWCFVDNPSCGFDDNVFVQIGFNKFQPACDGCAIVKNGNKYFNLSKEERLTLNKILSEYGITFPCV